MTENFYEDIFWVDVDLICDQSKIEVPRDVRNSKGP